MKGKITLRNPAVQGRFYPESKTKIIKLLDRIEKENRYPLEDISIQSVIGGILPHAGHIYSGYQTIPFFQLVQKHNCFPDTFVIVHPNHTGFGDPVSLDDSTTWNNAIGEIKLDKEFSELLDIPRNRRAHSYEHSCEVIIPYIQRYCMDKSFKILPVCMLDQSYDSAKKLGDKIYKAVTLSKRRIIVLASSDFSHFLSPDEGYLSDQFVLDEIEKGNTEGVYQMVRRHNISVCGYGPIMALMHYAGKVKPDYKKKLLARGHSGEVSPSSEVVDYISMLFYY